VIRAGFEEALEEFDEKIKSLLLTACKKMKLAHGSKLESVKILAGGDKGEGWSHIVRVRLRQVMNGDVETLLEFS
jgi:hypothetical protein